MRLGRRLRRTEGKMDVNIGSTIARERRARGITQEALAAHLGVTKAAVSKWEVGASLPDTALMPHIAAYFNITIDELFGLEQGLTREKIGELYGELWAAFGEDFDVAFKRVRAVVSLYYSSWELLANMASLLMAVPVLLEQPAEDPRAGACRAYAIELCERVEDNAHDPALLLGMRRLHASLLMMEGDVAAARTLLQADGAVSAEALAQLSSLDLVSDDVEAARGHGGAALRKGVQALSLACLTLLQAYGQDATTVDALLEALSSLRALFGVEAASPVALTGAYLGAACTHLQAGDPEGALLCLERFADEACALGEQDWSSEDASNDLPILGALVRDAPRVQPVPLAGQTRQSQGEAGTACLLAGYDAVLSAPEWAALANDPRFQAVAARIHALI